MRSPTGWRTTTRARGKRRVCGPVPARPQPVSPARCRRETLGLAFDEARHPGTGEQLGRPWRPDGVIGFDATFSAPKSVSLLFALGDSRGARPGPGRARDRGRGRGVGVSRGPRRVHASWPQRRDDHRHRRAGDRPVRASHQPRPGPAAALALSDPEQGPRRPGWLVAGAARPAAVRGSQDRRDALPGRVASRADPPPRGGLGSGE